MTRRGRPAHPDVLTPAEWEVLHCVRHGMTNRRIALARGTGIEAVKFHLENIRLKLGLREREAIRQWRGHAAGHSRRISMSQPEPVSLGHIGQISVHVEDIERAVAFYRDVLGIPHLFTFGNLGFMDCAGTRLFLDAIPEATHKETSVLYFTVPDIHAGRDGLAARGVAFESEPHIIHRHEDGTEEWMAFFRDPDNNMLAIMSAQKPG